jgi:hypothetical protein
MTLLRPSADGLTVLARRDATGLGHAAPVWTSDGRYVIAAGADRSSLSVYEVSDDGTDMHRVSSIRLKAPIEAMLAHPAESGVYTSRRDGAGSRVEFRVVRGGDLHIEKDAAIADRVGAMTEHAGNLWLVSDDRVICMERRDLRCVGSWSAPRPIVGAQAVITRSSNVSQS